MKPAPLTLHRPASTAQALAVFDSVGDVDEVKFIAGGQSLLPILAMRLAQPAHLVDLNPLEAELGGVWHTADGLRVGALVRHRELERSPLVARHCPLLAEAVRHVAHPAIRNRGTIGGSLAHSDPSAELPVVALATDASIRVVGRGGERVIRAADFFLGFLTTALEPDELLVDVRIPARPASSGSAFCEVSRRHGDFALVAVAVVVTLDRDRIVDARVALGGVAERAIRVEAVESELIGSSVDAEPARRAGARVATVVDPPGDGHASGEYRRHVAQVLVTRAVATAVRRARDGGRA